MAPTEIGQLTIWKAPHLTYEGQTSSCTLVGKPCRNGRLDAIVVISCMKEIDLEL